METYISKGTGKLAIIRILENPFYYKHLHLFCLLTVRLLFEDIAPSGLTASVYLWGLPSPPSLPCGSNRRLSQVSICWKWGGWFVSFRGLVELCLLVPVFNVCQLGDVEIPHEHQTGAK